MTSAMMSGEALAAALRRPPNERDMAYRDLVETIITEAEVDGAQERAWERQRRSQLRIAELEARDDERAGRAAQAASPAKQSAEDEESERQNVDEGTDRDLFSSCDVSSIDGNPPPVPGLPTQTGAEIRALEAELALSLERERDTVQRLRECGPLPVANFLEPDFGAPSKLGFGRSAGVTPKEESDWETESGSVSVCSTPSRWGTRKAAKRKEFWSPLGGLPGRSVSDGNASQDEFSKKGIISTRDAGRAEIGKKDLCEEAGLAKQGDPPKVRSESPKPGTPKGWEEVAQVKAEQLEEAKLLLAAVMDGERAALETVARLELELQASREAQLEAEQKSADAAAVARAQIEALSAIVEESLRRLREKDGKDGGIGERWDQGWGVLRESERSAKGGPGIGIENENEVQGNGYGLERRDGRVESASTTDTESASETDRSHVSARTVRTASKRGGKPARSISAASDNAVDDRNGSPLPSGHYSNHSDRSFGLNQSDRLEPERSDNDLDRSDNVSDRSERGAERRVSTVEELRGREAEYRSQCEELQQQVRRALDHVEVLRQQQGEREARVAAAYDTRLSAYVKQMVAVQRENEELRAKEQRHQEERERLQEQLDAEHEKRRAEFHAAQARTDSLSGVLQELSERLLERTSELQRTRCRALKTEAGPETADVSKAGLRGNEGGKNKGKETSVEAILAGCQTAMKKFEREADEVAEAMERLAEMGRELEERTAEMERKLEERTAEMGRKLEERTAEMGRELEERTAEMSRELEERGQQLARAMAEKNQALERMSVAQAERRELEGARVERDEALARERVLLVELRALEGVRVESGALAEKATRLAGQVASLEKTKAAYEKQVAALESRLHQQESTLAHYKADIQEELAGLAEQMHLAAAERAREDAEYRDRAEESDRTVRTQAETIGRLQGEVRELEQQLRVERGLSESVRQQLRALERGRGASRRSGEADGRGGETSVKDGEASERVGEAFKKGMAASEKDGDASIGFRNCPECKERREQFRREWQNEVRELQEERRRLEELVRTQDAEAECAARREEARVEHLNGKVLELVSERESFARVLSADTQGLVERVKSREAEVERLTALLKEQKVKVGGLEGTIKELLGERERMQRELERAEKQRIAVEGQHDVDLSLKQEEIDALREKVRQLERRGAGVNLEETGRRDWDAAEKEKLIAEVQDILEQYSVGGSGSVRWEKSTEGDQGEEERQDIRTEGTSEGTEGSAEGSEGMELLERQTEDDAPEASGTAAASKRHGVSETENRGKRPEGRPGKNGQGVGGRFEPGKVLTEERVRAEAQAALSEFERQSESVRRASETEIAALREKVRLLEQREEPTGESRGDSVEGGRREAGTADGLLPGRNDAFTDQRKGFTEDGGVRGPTAGVIPDLKRATEVGSGDGLAGQTAGLAKLATGQSARSSPGEQRSVSSGQTGVWSDKRPTGEGGAGPSQKEGGGLEQGPDPGSVQRALEDHSEVVQDNASLRLKVGELRESNRELQMRVKLLEADRSALLEKIASARGDAPPSSDADGILKAQAAEIAALQAQLAEAGARLAEQRGRYKHLKGKYLRQLARQQAMQEYMIQGGESPANLSPRSGVAPSVGRPRPSADDVRAPSGALSRLAPKPNGEEWPEPWGDMGPVQRQEMVAHDAQKQGVKPGDRALPSGRSSMRREMPIGEEGTEISRITEGEARNVGHWQSSGMQSGVRTGLGTLDEVPEKGPSSVREQTGVDARFPIEANGRLAPDQRLLPDIGSGRSLQAEYHEKNRVQVGTPYGSRASSRRPSRADSAQINGGIPSGRQSRAGSVPTRSGASSRRTSQTDSAATLSGIPVGLRVLMDGRPLPGFPAKVEDLGGYFAEARAQSDGAHSSAKLPPRRASSPCVPRTTERRFSRASSAPPMRPSYNRLARVWV